MSYLIRIDMPDMMDFFHTLNIDFFVVTTDSKPISCLDTCYLVGAENTAQAATIKDSGLSHFEE